MYESLVSQTPDSHVFIFPFDDLAYRILRSLDLHAATIVSLKDFEDLELLRVKPIRSRAEYCWTCSPSIVRYAIQKYDLPVCTYVDADTYFFSDSTPLLNEMESSEAMLIEHRFTPKHDRTATAGIYNVQFMPFRATPQGMRILEWWRNACLESCELNPEEGKCADQMYLNDWPTRFSGVHVLQHLGGGVAPWNVQQYSFSSSNGKVLGTRLLDQSAFELIFYHFHALRALKNGLVYPTNSEYSFDASVMKHIYLPYIAHLSLVAQRLKAKGFTLDPHGSTPTERPKWWVQARELSSQLRMNLGGGPEKEGTVNANQLISFAKAVRIAAPARGAIAVEF